MRITSIDIGSDFIQTGLVHNDNLNVYVKHRQYNNEWTKSQIRLIKGTSLYCTQNDQHYFVLNDYSPYSKLYKLKKGKFMVDALSRSSVLPYNEYEKDITIKDLKDKWKNQGFWFRFADEGLDTSAYSDDTDLSEESEYDSKLIDGEKVRLYRKKDVTEAKSKQNLHFVSLTSFESSYPLKIYDLGQSMEVLIPAKDGMYLFEGKRVDYLQYFKDDYYLSIEIPESKMLKLGLEKLLIEMIGLPGFTPITYYQISWRIKLLRHTGTFLLFLFLFFLSSPLYLLYNLL